MRLYMLIRRKKHHEHEHEPKRPMHMMLSECADIERVIENPPSTWDAYKHDAMKHKRIIDMEIAELQTAKREGDAAGYRENLIHVAAACMSAYRAEVSKGAE